MEFFLFGQLWGAPVLLSSGYWGVLIPGIKWARREAIPPLVNKR
jgi:hypothetical protein